MDNDGSTQSQILHARTEKVDLILRIIMFDVFDKKAKATYFVSGQSEGVCRLKCPIGFRSTPWI